MKIVKSTSQLILLFLVTLFVSCTYEPVDGTVEPMPDSGSNSGVFKADFSGKTWTANQTEALVSGHFIEIAAVNSKGETFAIMIEGATVGTYAANVNILAYNPAGSEYGYWGLNDDNPSEDTGSVTITTVDTEKKTISGTFHFKGYWSDSDNPKVPINFTNGVFKDIPYTTQEESTDVFTAKVGGTNFVATDILASEINDFITIGALDANFNNLSIAIKNTLGIGSYTIANAVLADVQGYYEDVNDEYKAVSGTITITSKTNNRIKGTFKFNTNGVTQFVITEGAFDIEY